MLKQVIWVVHWSFRVYIMIIENGWTLQPANPTRDIRIASRCYGIHGCSWPKWLRSETVAFETRKFYDQFELVVNWNSAVWSLEAKNARCNHKAPARRGMIFAHVGLNACNRIKFFVAGLGNSDWKPFSIGYRFDTKKLCWKLQLSWNMSWSVVRVIGRQAPFLKRISLGARSEGRAIIANVFGFDVFRQSFNLLLDQYWICLACRRMSRNSSALHDSNKFTNGWIGMTEDLSMGASFFFQGPWPALDFHTIHWVTRTMCLIQSCHGGHRTAGFGHSSATRH